MEPTKQEGVSPNPLKDTMSQAMNVLEQANGARGGKLFVGIGQGDRKALIFDTPVGREINLPDGQKKGVDEFLVVTVAGYKLIQVDEGHDSESWIMSGAEMSYGSLTDGVAWKIGDRRHDGEVTEKIVEEAANGDKRKKERAAEWTRDIPTLGYSQREGLVLAPGFFAVNNTGGYNISVNPIYHGNIPQMRLVDNPDEEVVNQIVQANTKRVEEEGVEQVRVEASRQALVEEGSTAKNITQGLKSLLK